MTSFLLAYSRTTGKVKIDSDFASSRDAMEARMRAESTSSDPDLEFTVLEAENLEDLLATHSRYFESSQKMAARLIAQTRGRTQSDPNVPGVDEEGHDKGA